MDIYVYIDAEGLTDSPLLMGLLHTEKVRGKEVFSFRASKEWIANQSFAFLDADLGKYSGNQYAPDGKENFGIFTDSCPDRWGRILMQRRERLKARDESRAIRRLNASDYLLGVYDGNRMGALRFKTSTDGPFLDNDSELATPPVTSLRMLEQSSLNYERDDAEESPNYRKWVRALYSPGSSLGGARPKANVVDTDGSLWIAKFPSRHDTVDVGAWEYIVTSMANDFGIKTPETKVGKYSSSHHTFMTKRFDRNPNGRRLYFASAMTLLGYTDGDGAMEGASYLELAEFLERFGTPRQNEDLRELWKRIIFNIAISNCDDHLRNHGFILSAKGWSLSPAFDLTPNPTGTGLALNIDEADNALDFDLAISSAPYYGIDKSEALSLVKHCKSVCSNWRARASQVGISRSEQETMSPAFNV